MPSYFVSRNELMTPEREALEGHLASFPPIGFDDQQRQLGDHLASFPAIAAPAPTEPPEEAQRRQEAERFQAMMAEFPPPGTGLIEAERRRREEEGQAPDPYEAPAAVSLRVPEPGIVGLDPRDRERLDYNARLNEEQPSGADTATLNPVLRGIDAVGRFAGAAIEGVSKQGTRVLESAHRQLTDPKTLEFNRWVMNPTAAAMSGVQNPIERDPVMESVGKAATTVGDVANLVPGWQGANMAGSALREMAIEAGVPETVNVGGVGVPVADITAMALQMGVPGAVKALGPKVPGLADDAGRAVAARIEEEGGLIPFLERGSMKLPGPTERAAERAARARGDAPPEVDASLSGLVPQMERTLTRAAGTADQAAQLRAGEDLLGFKGVPDEVRALIQREADATNGFAGQRRGVITDPEAQRQAAEKALGTTIPQWLRTKPGKAFNQEEALALGNTLVKVGRDYDQLLTDVTAARAAGTVTANMEAALANQALEFASLAAIRRGAAAEAGRALRSFQTTLDGAVASGLGREKAIERAFEAIGTDKTKFADWLEGFSKLDPNDPIARYQYLQALYKPSLMDNLVTWRYASMLSSWRTHLANATSNLAESATRPLELAHAGYGREAWQDVRGMAGSLSDAAAVAVRAFRSHGVTMDLATKTDNVRPAALTGNLVSKIVRAPLDALSASDEFFKAINTAGSLRAQAYRLSGGNAAKMEELLANPTRQMLDTARAAAQKATYQEDPGAWVRTLIQLRRVDSPKDLLGLGTQLVLPFVKTPANIGRRAVENIARPITGTVATVKALGAGDIRTARVDAARTAMASELLLGVGGLAMAGFITGSGPSDPNKRRLMEASGWQSNSLRMPGGGYVSLNNFGAAGQTAIIVANAWEGMLEAGREDKDWQGHAGDVLSRTAQALVDTSYLKGIAGLFEGVANRDFVQAAGNFVGDTAASMVPWGSGLAAAERVGDPVTRARDNVLDTARGRLPWLSGGLPAEPGPYGEPRRTYESRAAAILSPFRTSQQQDDPVANEVARLLQAGQSVSVKQLGRNDEYAGAKQSPEQRRFIQTEMGQATRAYLSEWIARTDYRALSDAQKAETLNKALSVAYKLADLDVGERAERAPVQKALLAWAQTPQYVGVKGTPAEIARQNAEISEAKALQREYRAKYGRDQGDVRLLRENRAGFLLAQRQGLDDDYLQLKRRRIDQQFGVDTARAEQAGLLGAGNTVLNAPQGFTAPVTIGATR